MSWSEIKVTTAGNYIETVANFFHETNAGGVVIEQGPGAQSSAIAYLQSGPGVEDVLARLENLFSDLGENLEYSITPIKEEDWAEEWKKYYHPVTIGSVTIKPSWLDFSGASPIVIELDPGLAFGTGIHPTTQLCVRELVKLVRPGWTVIDIGSGSGILSILAAKLGAHRVTGYEIDSMAVRIARENSLRNNCSVNFIEADALKGDLLQEADLLVANIGFNAALTLLGLYADKLKAGLMVLSGFSNEQLQQLQRQADAAEIFVRSRTKDGWGCLVVGQ